MLQVQDQYVALKKNGIKASVAEEGDGVKRPMRNTNSKVIEKRDTTSFTLQDTSQGVMTQNEARDERKRQEKEERMKAYTEIQIKKLNMEEAIKRRKLDMEAIQVKKFEIEAINQTKKQKRWHFFS